VKSGLFLDVVVTKSSSVFQLLSSEDESLLIGGNTFLVLDLSFHILNGVWWFNIESDGLSCEGFDEDLHSSSESEHQVESRLLLDVVVGESSSIFQLLSCKDESLLIGWDTFFVLDLSLDVFNGVRWLNIKSDGLASKSLNEDLHSSSQSEDQVKSRFFLDVVVW
jgi:hypothetical protein